MFVKNNPQAFFDQQYGISTWRDCNSVLHRLKCKKANTFNCVLPIDEETMDSFYRDTPIFACKFAPLKGSEHLVALANEDGKLAIHNSENNTRYGVHAHNNAIFDLAWKFNELKLVTASGDHTLKLHDIGNGGIELDRVFYGHLRSVKTVAFRRDGPDVLASGGRDGNIALWDARCPDDDHSLFVDASRIIGGSHCGRPPTPGRGRGARRRQAPADAKSVTGLAFQDENTLISCGAGDGLIKVWDLRKNYSTGGREANPKYVLPYAGATSRNGFSCLQVDEGGVRLYASCLDNTIYCYNVAAYDAAPVARYAGHQNGTFYVRASLCRDGDHLLSGSSDGAAYVWDVRDPRPLLRLAGHAAEVTCVAWSRADHTLMTCSDDTTHRLWTVEADTDDDGEEVDGSVKAEAIPLRRPGGAVKRRPSLTAGGTPAKAAAATCRACDAASPAALCENCHRRLKRGRRQDESGHRAPRELGPKRLFGSLLQEGEEEDAERPAKVGRRDGSPEKGAAGRVTDSPTANLPNFVVDGTAPHLSYSPPPKRRRPDDWLTRLRVERSLRREMAERAAEAGPSAPKSPRLELPPRAKQSPRPKAATPGSLLRFFKVGNGKCEIGPCSSKPHNCNNVLMSRTHVNN